MQTVLLFVMPESVAMTKRQIKTGNKQFTSRGERPFAPTKAVTDMGFYEFRR